MLYYFETNNEVMVQKNTNINAHRDYMDYYSTLIGI